MKKKTNNKHAAVEVCAMYKQHYWAESEAGNRTDERNREKDEWENRKRKVQFFEMKYEVNFITHVIIIRLDKCYEFIPYYNTIKPRWRPRRRRRK